METIYLITSGGTIEKQYSEQTSVVLNNNRKIGDYLKRLRLPECNARVVPHMNKESLERKVSNESRQLTRGGGPHSLRSIAPGSMPT
jgi:hypothetical protein